MTNNSKLLVIIPARSGSKGLPGKNIKLFCGKPLLAWPIIAAIESNLAARVILSTDSEEYAKIGLKYGAQVPFLRPKQLSLDSSPSFSFVEHCIGWCRDNLNEQFDYIALLEPTSPLTDSNDLKKAYENLLCHGFADSIVSVTRAESFHPSFSLSMREDGFLDASSFANGLRRQDLTDCYFLDGGLYISKVDSYLQNKGFYHSKTIGIELARYKSIEIDTLEDFICAEALMKHREVLS
jgi:CMP-N,N'-diacetyllegionaminic acid synthase